MFVKKNYYEENVSFFPFIFIYLFIAFQKASFTYAGVSTFKIPVTWKSPIRPWAYFLLHTTSRSMVKIYAYNVFTHSSQHQCNCKYCIIWPMDNKNSSIFNSIGFTFTVFRNINFLLLIIISLITFFVIFTNHTKNIKTETLFNEIHIYMYV